MNKSISLLLFTLFLSPITISLSPLYAANPTDVPHRFCDFETPAVLPASQFHAPSGGGTVNIVANPSKTGLNTSNTVLKITSPGGVNWGGAIFNEVSLGENHMMTLYGVQKVTGYDLVSLLMYRESNTNVPQLKTVDIDDDGHGDPTYLDLKPLSVDGDENYVANGTIKTGKWQKVVYSVTHCHNSGIHFIYIMPDRETSSTVYVDDIIFEKDDTKPVMQSASCIGISTSSTISLSVSATDDLSDPVNRFLVSTDGNQAHATEYKAAGGVITVTGLTAGTTYTFTVWAKDYAGNVSDNSKTATCSTETAPTGDWCQKVLTSGGHTIYVSCELIGTKYVFTVESNETLSGFGGTFFNPGAVDLRTTITSQTANKIVCEINAASAPTFYTPLYVLMPAEVVFSALQNATITWGTCTTPCVPTTGDTTAYVCQGKDFYWRGALAHDGDKITLTNKVGCDSVVTLHLVQLATSTGDTTAVAIESFTWYGKNLTTSGDYTYTLTNAAGCDSVVTLHLTINPPEPPTPTCKELIMRKWDDLLFVNNADSLFVAYQWYQDGQELKGETKQYLYTAGQLMDGDGHEYSAWAFLSDGSHVVACAKKFEAFQHSAELNPGGQQKVAVYPNPVRRSMPVKIDGVEDSAEITVFNVSGQLVTKFTGAVFVADLPVGCYLMYSVVEDDIWCAKLIVE